MSDIYIDDWLKKVDIDFYQMFIRAWIPFNAWYMRNYHDYENKIDSDKIIIGIIKTQENPYKTKIITLLKGNSEDSKDFKKHIGKLYDLLEAVILPNEQNRISFSSMKLHDNNVRQRNIAFNKKTYKFEYLITQQRTTKRFRCDIINNLNQNSSGLIELHRCVLSEIEEQPDYISQPDRIKDIIKQGFEEINPNKAISIVISSNKGIKINDDLYFINNINLIAQFIIEMLYQLRCKIFHGEIDPRQNFIGIYENAYHIQKMLVKSLN